MSDSDDNIFSAIDGARDPDDTPAAEWVPVSSLIVDHPAELPDRLAQLEQEHYVQTRMNNEVQEVRLRPKADKKRGLSSEPSSYE